MKLKEKFVALKGMWSLADGGTLLQWGFLVAISPPAVFLYFFAVGVALRDEFITDYEKEASLIWFFTLSLGLSVSTKFFSAIRGSLCEVGNDPVSLHQKWQKRNGRPVPRLSGKLSEEEIIFVNEMRAKRRAQEMTERGSLSLVQRDEAGELALVDENRGALSNI